MAVYRFVAALLVFVTVATLVTARSPMPLAGSAIFAADRLAPDTVSAAADDLSIVTPLPLVGNRRDQFRSFIEEAMEACPSPGIAVAVIQNGETVFLEGFGVREQGRLDSVTPDTLFRIGSITKSVTATLAAALVDAGLVTWDTPVVDLLPDFALSDSVVSEQVTVAGLLSAATGLPRRDLEIVLEADTLTPEGLLDSVETLPLLAPLGERFQYSNQAYGVAGYALAAAAGASPNDLRNGYALGVERYILDPMGMERSTFSLATVLERDDYALPHAPDLSGETQPIPLLMEERFVQAVAPAGALWSSAREMAQYLETLLARGIAPDGDRVISEESLLRTWQPGVAVPEDTSFSGLVDARIDAYGLGWFVGDYGGLELLSHSGGTYGFGAEAAFLPEANLGAVALTNDAVCGGLLAFAIQHRLFELVFDREPVVTQLLDTITAELAEGQVLLEAQLQPVDLDEVTPLLGWYEHPALGPIEFTIRSGEFVVDAGEVQSRLRVLPLELDGLNAFVAIDPPLLSGEAWIEFEEDETGATRPVLTVLDTIGEDPLIYPFTPLLGGDAPLPTPAP
jgi:CubicO group peptidase (beta-lactamase class C family)